MNSSSKHSANLTAIARVIKERGIKGEIKALPLVPGIDSLKMPLAVCIRFPDGRTRDMKMLSARPDRNAVLLSFQDISDRDDASVLRNATVEINVSSLPELQPGKYYHHQIIGLLVFTVDGIEIGRVTSIIETGANDVYTVQGRTREYLIPAVRDIIAGIDLDAGTMIIRKMDGLLD